MEELINYAKNICDLDVTKITTREELIEKIINQNEIKINFIFQYLTEEEKQKYRQRYINNKKIDLMNTGNLLNEIKTNLFGLKNIVFDEKNKTLIKKSVN